MFQLANDFALKLRFLGLVLCLIISASPVFVASASAETRSLKLYYINTGDRATITFKKNGRYIQSGLTKLNKFLRDWRVKESTKMDPRLFDLVWEVHKATGSKNSIHVVSAYRSPKTNAMLRRTRGGQATKSQHMYGRAMDFFIPGVKSSNIRKIALKKGWGGVGYYPRSNSPYVHLDTARVRHWPRMNRKQLVALFPKGRTLHVPTDGKPLKGYNLAARDDKKRRAGKNVQDQVTPSLLAALGLGGKNEAEEAPENVQIPRAVQATEVASLPQTTALPKSAPREILLARASQVEPQTEPQNPLEPGPLAPNPAPDQNALIATNTREEEPITIALLPRSAPRDRISAAIVEAEPEIANNSENFGGLLAAAHNESIPIKAPQGADILQGIAQNNETTDAQTIDIIPRARPNIAAEETQVASIETNDRGNGLRQAEIAAPAASAEASPTGFTPDGAIALGKLNGNNVVQWAVASTNASNVQLRGLRPPAYGQNAIRLPSKKLLQKGFSQDVKLDWNRLKLS